MCTLPSDAFKTGKIWGLRGRQQLMYQDIHEQIFQTALSRFGFVGENILKVNDGACMQDDMYSKRFTEKPQNHFDDRNLATGWNYFKQMRDFAIDHADGCFQDPEKVRLSLQEFGEGFHALQDFYSHSNYIELALSKDQRLQIPEDFEKYIYDPPKALKTGYFTMDEFWACVACDFKGRVASIVTIGGARIPDGKKLGGGSSIITTRTSLDQFREDLVSVVPNHPLEFHTQEEFIKRWRVKDHYYSGVNYVIPDPNTGKDWDVLHCELNKDWPDELQGQVIVDDPMLPEYKGKKLFELAKMLAIDETARQWRIIEDRIWEKYDCAALILPALKGNVIPFINMELKPESQIKPDEVFKGRITVSVSNLPLNTTRKPLKIKVELKMMPGGDTAEKIIDVVDGSNEDIELESFGLKARNISPIKLIAKASYVCAPNFKPVTKEATVSVKNKKIKLRWATIRPDPGKLSAKYKLQAKFDVEGLPPGPENTMILRVTGSMNGPNDMTSLREQNITINGNDPTALVEYDEDDWKPRTPGEYRWRFTAKGVDAPEISGIATVTVEPDKPEKHLRLLSTRLTQTSYTVGDPVTLEAEYELEGFEAGDNPEAGERCRITNDAGFVHNIPPPNPLERITGHRRTKVWTFTPAAPGIYTWCFDIDVAGYPEHLNNCRGFLVLPKGQLPQKRIVLVAAHVAPQNTQPPGSTFNLHVEYRLEGVGPNEQVTVQERGSVAGPVGGPLQAQQSIVTQNTGTISKDFQFPAPSMRALVDGDYQWTYEIDAGPSYGRLTPPQPLDFYVRSQKRQKRLQLVSAAVLPGVASVGNAFQLRIRYRVLGLQPGESVTLTDDDYVTGWRPEYHPTRYVTVTADNPVITKVATYTSSLSGNYVWHFVAGSGEFEPLAHSIPFFVMDGPRERLSARLQFPVLVLEPGETKNCSIYIRGYRKNTADRVEVIYPERIDGWGTVPGQVQVFPSDTSMDPWSMAGAGDYTSEYACGQGYRARETAPPGLVPVKIVVRQKGAGQVNLILMVKILKKGESSLGGESGPFPPAVPPGGKDAGTAGEGPGVGGDGSGTTGDGSGTGDGGPGAGGGPGTGGENSDQEVTYYFQKAVINVTPVAGITLGGYSALAGQPEFREFTSTDISIPVDFSDSSKVLAGEAVQSVRATVKYSFPSEIKLRASQADPTLFSNNMDISCSAKAEFTRSGPSSVFGSGPAGIFVVDSDEPGGPKANASTRDSKSFSTGTEHFSKTWSTSPLVSERANMSSGTPTHDSSWEIINTGETYVGIGSANWARTVRPSKLIYSPKPGTAQDDAGKDDGGIKQTQISARLEQPKIILEAGRLPSINNTILIEHWNRNTAEMVVVEYPGQSSMNSLPNDMQVFPGTGSQLPDALARMQSDNGVYKWSQLYLATRNAKPGTYTIPITVRQKTAGAVYLNLEVQIIPSSSKLGDLTSMTSKVGNGSSTAAGSSKAGGAASSNAGGPKTGSVNSSGPKVGGGTSNTGGGASNTGGGASNSGVVPAKPAAPAPGVSSNVGGSVATGGSSTSSGGPSGTPANGSKPGSSNSGDGGISVAGGDPIWGGFSGAANPSDNSGGLKPVSPVGGSNTSSSGAHPGTKTGADSHSKPSTSVPAQGSDSPASANGQDVWGDWTAKSNPSGGGTISRVPGGAGPGTAAGTGIPSGSGAGVDAGKPSSTAVGGTPGGWDFNPKANPTGGGTIAKIPGTSTGTVIPGTSSRPGGGTLTPPPKSNPPVWPPSAHPPVRPPSAPPPVRPPLGGRPAGNSTGVATAPGGGTRTGPSGVLVQKYRRIGPTFEKRDKVPTPGTMGDPRSYEFAGDVVYMTQLTGTGPKKNGVKLGGLPAILTAGQPLNYSLEMMNIYFAGVSGRITFLNCSASGPVTKQFYSQPVDGGITTVTDSFVFQPQPTGPPEMILELANYGAGFEGARLTYKFVPY